MKSSLKFFVFLLVPLSTISQPFCHVTYENDTETIRRPESYENIYRYRQEHFEAPMLEYDPVDGRRYIVYNEAVIVSSTIACSNVNFIDKISHVYKEENYEQFLIITSSNVSTIQPLALVSFTTITKLYLSQIHIKNIKPGAFSGLSRLRELHLDNNELSEVLNGVYNTLHRLELLNFTNNKILRINDFAFMGMGNLLTLYLKNNNLSKIEKGVFETQLHLKYLDLFGNPLEELSLDGLTNLDTLVLTRSSLRNFDEDLSNSTLKLLDLSLSELSVVDFSYFPKVDKVDLSKNKIVALKNCEMLDALFANFDTNIISTINGSFHGISEIYLGHNKLEILDGMLFQNSKNLLIVDLSFNKISSINKNLFQELRSLKKLFLQNNNIIEIDTVLFQDLTDLTFLNLSHNKIEEFQYGTFDGLTSLEVFDISGNRLVDLHQYTFNSLSKLLSLRFDNNRISSFNVKDLKSHLQSLQFVSLNKNPWNCKELVKINQVFKSMQVIVLEGDDYDVENFHGIACLNQKNVFNRTIGSEVTVETFVTNLQKAIDEGVKNSKLNNFFNDDFKDSRFFQYFNNDYVRSNFFKFLNDYKFVPVKQELNNSKAEKFTSLQIVPRVHNTASPVEILNTILLSSVLLSTICVVYLLMGYLRKYKLSAKTNLSSQIELC